MLYKIMALVGVIGICVCVTVGAGAPATQPSARDNAPAAFGAPPSTRPIAALDSAAATRPQGFVLFGRVKISPGWELRKPDMSRVVVYLGSSPALDSTPVPEKPQIIAQQDKSFNPKFIAISRGTAVEFPNLDPFDHNVFSRSKAAPAFDLLRYPYGQSKARVFDKTGIVQLFCNIHPDMRAIIFVTPNPFFTHIDTEGLFQIRDIPAGDYELNVWNERCKELRQTVRVGPGLLPDLSLTLEESRDNIFANDPPQHKNNYGIERGLSVEREHLGLPVVDGAHPLPPPSARDSK